jgi:hypothetical protein
MRINFRLAIPLDETSVVASTAAADGVRARVGAAMAVASHRSTSPAGRPQLMLVAGAVLLAVCCFGA